MSLAQVFDLTGTKVVKFCWLFLGEERFLLKNATIVRFLSRLTSNN